ncbi:MAG: tyrosine-protein phosphatase [Opitutaceae bacterium]|jgi:protein tyrosine/serine phosphatase|nr:tyrosine-protein phosphatase [Opitutaceae bacterium]
MNQQPPVPPLTISPLEGGINFRDLGGLPAANGRRVRPGLLFRSGTLAHLTPADRARLAAARLTRVLDLRDAVETAREPDALWDGARYENIPANPLGRGAGASIDQYTPEFLEKLDPRKFMRDLYRELPLENRAYRRLMAVLRETEPGAATVFHCAVGKDRTGVAAAIVLLALGADRATLLADYTRTEQTLAPHRERVQTALAGKLDGLALEHLRVLMAAREEFIAVALASIESRGGADAWLAAEFGLDAPARAALQAKYLE